MDNKEDSSKMEIEVDEKLDINEPIDLEQAANTLIEIGLQELQQAQPKKMVPLQKQGKQKSKSQGTRPITRPATKPKKTADSVAYKHLNRILKQLTEKNNEVNELKKKITSMEHNLSVINVEKPKFSTPQHTHPLNFIENLISYIENNPSVNSTVEAAVDCLYGDAKSWAIILKPSWEHFDDFKKAFLHQYWSDAEQSMLRREIINGFWDRRTETMCRHFMCLIAQARWLSHQIPDEELVYEIMTHYPRNVQVAWCASKNTTVLEAIEFLRNLDDMNKRFERKQKMNQLSQQSNKQNKRKNQPPSHEQQCKYTIETKVGKQLIAASMMGQVESENLVVVD